MFIFFIVASLVVLALDIALLVWVARDAKNRGMDNAVVWMLLVFFTGLIGFIIYIFSRPQGDLVQCDHCNGWQLQASRKCPHCGSKSGLDDGGGKRRKRRREEDDEEEDEEDEDDRPRRRRSRDDDDD